MLCKCQLCLLFKSDRARVCLLGPPPLQRVPVSVSSNLLCPVSTNGGAKRLSEGLFFTESTSRSTLILSSESLFKVSRIKKKFKEKKIWERKPNCVSARVLFFREVSNKDLKLACKHCRPQASKITSFLSRTHALWQQVCRCVFSHRAFAVHKAKRLVS